jgi:hypothetical protein
MIGSPDPRPLIPDDAFVARTQPMYNLTVAQAHTFFVGDGQWLVHNCSTRQVVKQQGGNYVSFYDMTIPAQSRIAKRDVHFEIANEHLYKTLMNDPQLRGFFQTNYPDVWNHVQPGSKGGFLDDSPPGFTWHHATSAQANGQMGVMQLVDHDLHRDYFKRYHPTGSGGCKEWGGGCR